MIHFFPSDRNRLMRGNLECYNPDEQNQNPFARQEIWNFRFTPLLHLTWRLTRLDEKHLIQRVRMMDFSQSYRFRVMPRREWWWCNPSYVTVVVFTVWIVINSILLLITSSIDLSSPSNLVSCWWNPLCHVWWTSFWCLPIRTSRKRVTSSWISSKGLWSFPHVCCLYNTMDQPITI